MTQFLEVVECNLTGQDAKGVATFTGGPGSGITVSLEFTQCNFPVQAPKTILVSVAWQEDHTK